MQVTLQHVVQAYCKSKLKLREREKKKKVSGWDLNLGTRSRQENLTNMPNGFYSVLGLIKAYAIT